jgi:hypothetical protein
MLRGRVMSGCFGIVLDALLGVGYDQNCLIAFREDRTRMEGGVKLFSTINMLVMNVWPLGLSW